MIYFSRIIAFTAAALTVCGCSVHSVTQANDPGNLLLDRSKNALCLPLDTLHVTYVDNTKASPDTLFNDSFFIEAGNSLLLYEAAKNFSIRQWTSEDVDSLSIFRRGGFSRLSRDTVFLTMIAARIAGLAKKYNADLVIVPYACTGFSSCYTNRSCKSHYCQSFTRACNACDTGIDSR